MAGTGPLPKAERQRERDTKRRQGEFVTVTRDGVLRGPTLATATGISTWEPGTLAWWETWRLAPQAAVFETTDWGALARVAGLYDANLRRPSAAAASEVRMTEAALGGSFADRLRARIRIEDAPDGTAEVVPLHSVGRADIRARLARTAEPVVDELEPPF